MTEGRIRDMESALGVSYPTVKSRLAALKARLGLDAERAEPGAGDGGGIESSAVAENGGLEVEPRAVSDILDALERSEIDVAEALQRLEARKE